MSPVQPDIGMRYGFETLGNATIQLFEDDKPLLVTDPWLKGTCYFDSWALERPASHRQIENAVQSDHLWISHGHPDHLHPESLALFKPGTKALIADHYSRDIGEALEGLGFAVTVMAYKQWYSLSESFEILSVDNPDQDSILVIRTPDSLIINLNDSDLWGENAFLQSLVRDCPTDRTFMLAICDYMGDMRNIVDRAGRRIEQDLRVHAEGCVRRTARIADRLGVKHFCCSSSQHYFVREDSQWANAGKITYNDMKTYWSRPNVRLIGPFSQINIDTLEIQPVAEAPAEPSRSGAIPAEPWDTELTDEEWSEVEAFFLSFETLQGVVDDIGITVGKTTRTIEVTGSPLSTMFGRRRLIRFHAPKTSLLDCARRGYFDDLLLGNFVMTELVNARLYADFTPLIAKYGGNAGIKTPGQLRAFWRRYRRRDPLVYLRWNVNAISSNVIETVKRLTSLFGIKRPARALFWKLRGDVT